MHAAMGISLLYDRIPTIKPRYTAYGTTPRIGVGRGARCIRPPTRPKRGIDTCRGDSGTCEISASGMRSYLY